MALPRIVDVHGRRRVGTSVKPALKEAETVLAALEKSHADAAAEPKAFTAKRPRSVKRDETPGRDGSPSCRRDATAEQRIADEQAASRETIPEVAGDVTRAAVERLTGASVADTDVQSAVNASWRGGA